MGVGVGVGQFLRTGLLPVVGPSALRLIDLVLARGLVESADFAELADIVEHLAEVVADFG